MEQSGIEVAIRTYTFIYCTDKEENNWEGSYLIDQVGHNTLNLDNIHVIHLQGLRWREVSVNDAGEDRMEGRGREGKDGLMTAGERGEGRGAGVKGSDAVGIESWKRLEYDEEHNGQKKSRTYLHAFQRRHECL